MRSYFIFVVLLFFHKLPFVWAAPAPTASFVQGCVNSNSGGIVTCAMAANVTKGNLLVVRAKVSTQTTAAVTISSSAGVSVTWSSAGLSPATGVSVYKMNEAVYYGIVPSTGAQTVRASWTNANGDFNDISVAEYSATYGWDSSPLDKSLIATSGATRTVGTSCATGNTATLSQGYQLVIGICQTWDTAQTWGAVTGYNRRSACERNTDSWHDKVVTSTAAVSYTTAIASDAWIAHIATFKMLTKVSHRVIQD